MTSKDSSEENLKIKKQKNIFARLIRYEVILIISIITLLVTLYFTLFFTTHLKWIAQRSLTKIYGAEVNISSIDIGLNPPKLKINRIQFTNHQKPTHNFFEIGNIDFELNTNELLFLSFVSEKAFVTGVMVDTLRTHPGYVSPQGQQLVSMSLDLKKNKRAVLEKKSEGNILENLMSFSKTKDIGSEIKKLNDEFQIDDLTKKYELKLKEQNDLLKNYENFLKIDHAKEIETEFKILEAKSKSQSNDTAKILALVSESKTFLDKIKSKKEEVKKIKTQFKDQLSAVKNLKAEFNKDLQEKKQALKAKFKIPDISPDALAKDFFEETVTTRFYLFNFWLEQIRKQSEQKVQNVTNNVLNEKNSKILKEKTQAYLESSKNEKSIKVELQEIKESNNQIIHFGNHVRPKFWIKKSMIQADAKGNQDLRNFKGEILDISSDQRLINKPILVSFQGDLPKENINNIKILAKLNHHLLDINEEFNIKADYPISSFKIIDDGSLKFYLSKALASTDINGKLLKKEINNLKINSELNSAILQFESTKSDIQKILKPIIENITAFNLDVLLNGPIANPDLKIISSLTQKISEGLKLQVSDQLSKLTTDLDSKINQKTTELTAKLFGKQESDLNKAESSLIVQDKGLDTQNNAISNFIKNNSSKPLDKITDKLKNKLFK